MKATERREVDVAATERAEAELNRLVDRQAERSGANEQNSLEATWRISEKAQREKQREENRTGWILYYSHLARSFRKRVDKYDAKAEQLLEEGNEV